MMRLYISGAMSGLPQHNFPAFFGAEELLKQAGYEVENPAEKGIIDGWSWRDYLEYDLIRMFKCDGVATLPGWENSKGANLEVYVALTLGMRVLPADEWILEAFPVRVMKGMEGV